MKNLARLLTCTFRSWNVPTLAMAIAFGLALCCPSARAQSGAGSIQGTVTDSTGAVIPGAKIHVVNQATAVSTDATSNGVGFYQVPALFAGTYEVTVTAASMKTYKTNVQLLVAQAAVINPVLTPGEVTQQVEVAATTVQLTTTDNGTIASTLENARINQMPLNGRVLTSLVGMMAPGVEGGQRANGLMAEALEYVADGVPLSNRQFGGMNQASAQTPDPDSVQEVRVETTNTSAQFSEPGTVIITTKSGTNQLHGSLFETARNNGIGNAKPRTVNYILPHLVRNEFGASAGGPIILPHVYHGKDKSFWFLAFEKYSLASSSPENVTVPTMAMRQGDFSGLINSAGVLQQLYDFRTTQNSAACAGNPKDAANPYCRTPYTNNQIPIGLLSPTMKLIYDITQQPGTSDNPLVSSNLSTPNPNNTFIPTWTFRFDHAFNENNRAYLRYTSNVQDQKTLRNYPSNSPYTIAADGFPFQASGIAYNPTATYAVALGYTHVFSPTFFAETILSQQWFSQHNYAGGTPFANFEQKLGLPNNFGESGFPNFGSNLICPYGGTMFIYGLSQIVANLDENLTKTIGRHQMQFGGRYRHERFGYLPDELNDTVSFGSQATGLYDVTTGASYGNVTNTGNQNADAFIGAASSYGINKQPPYAHFHDMEFDAYYQDNFHINKDLTVNLGVRWEAHPATWLKGGTMQAFDLKNDAMVLASTPAQLIAEGYTTQAIITNLANIGARIETPQQAGLPSKLVYDYNLNFSPRVGFAYQPFGGKHGTVLRGAYGRYIYPIPVRTTYKPILQNSPYTAGYSTSYTSAAQTPDSLPNYLLRVNSLPVVMGTNSANVINSSSTVSVLPGINLYTLNPILPPDFVTQVNVTVEQPLKGNSALRVTYLYSHGTNLDQEYYYNPHPSTFTWEVQTGALPPTGGTSVIGTSNQYTYASTGTGPYDKTTWGGSAIVDQKSGWSNDNALQASFQRLYHNGVAWQISYVWSKPFRLGGNYFRDGIVTSDQMYGTSGVSTYNITPGTTGTIGPYRLPPAHPANVSPYAYWHDMDRWANYHIDPAIPKHHIQFNGIYDIPIGTGKKYLSGANRWLNMLVGGFQLAGDGNIASNDFLLVAATSTSTPTLNWGPANPLHIYKHGKKITDCTSGVCRAAFLWFNGYNAPSVTSGCVGVKCITGIPSDVQPYSQPIDVNYNPTTPGGTAQDANYNTNNVTINLTNGKTDKQGFMPGGGIGQQQHTSNVWARTVVDGPFNYTVDLSVFKTIPITERVALRFNFDAFNALNMQGYTNPSPTSGIEQLTSSFNSPRQVQMTLRLQF